MNKAVFVIFKGQSFDYAIFPPPQFLSFLNKNKQISQVNFG